MPWHVHLYNVLNSINSVILIIIGIPFMLQFIYMFLFWLPKKKFPKSEKKGRIAVIIPAHNEGEVISDTVKLLFAKQKYPRELFDVYVVAHNCTDDTATLAEQAGAKVLVFNDPDPRRGRAAYALNHGMQQMLATGIPYDFVLHIDADNHLNDEFFSLMNDAFQAGCQIARPYESALNMTQNKFTKACGLYYTFDSRFSSRVRERLHIDAHVNGSGAMYSYEIIKRVGGYDCTAMADDTEFCFKRMLQGYRCHFVEDAIVYEDLPSTFKDTFSRNRRIAAGNLRLLGRYTPALLWNSIKQFRFSFIEQLLTYMFNIICVILCTWIPFFYIFDVAYLWANGLYTNASASAVGLNAPGLYSQLTLVGLILLVLFIVAGIGQGMLLVLLDYRKLGATKRRQLIDGALLFPAFTVVYCLTMALGAFLPPKWNKVKRNKVATVAGTDVAQGDEPPALLTTDETANN